jgi:hypothetical protein
MGVIGTGLSDDDTAADVRDAIARHPRSLVWVACEANKEDERDSRS